MKREMPPSDTVAQRVKLFNDFARMLDLDDRTTRYVFDAQYPGIWPVAPSIVAARLEAVHVAWDRGP